jgi:hypothetical protein
MTTAAAAAGPTTSQAPATELLARTAAGFNETTFAAALPAGFTSTATQTNLTSMRSYYRDSNGEWAPVSTRLVPAMVRCDFNGSASVGINAQATGVFAVIVVQCTTYRNNAPSVLWSSFPGGTKTSMSTASAYVQCATAPETALTFVAGVNAAGEVLSAMTRQTQVAFSVARVTGETARWYNGIKEQTSTVAFDATQTQVVDGGLVRVLSWYDNEWGFSNRMSDTAALFGRL